MKEEKEKQLFYTNDPDYAPFNNMKFDFVKEIEEADQEENSRYAVRLENGYLIRAFGDELNGFIRRHEKEPISLSVNWEVCGVIRIPGCATIAEAIEIFNNTYDEIPLPAENYYIDGSFELSTDEPADEAIYNYSFLNPDRIRNSITEGELDIQEGFWEPFEIKNEAGACPICGRQALEYGTAELRDESYGYPWTCKQCGAEGTEWYNLEFSEHILKGQKNV